MSDLDKDKRTMDDLPGIVKVPAIEVGVHKRLPRTTDHCAAISKGTKAFYESEAGEKERKARSERTKKYWASPEGQAKKDRLRNRPKK